MINVATAVRCIYTSYLRTDETPWITSINSINSMLNFQNQQKPRNKTERKKLGQSINNIPTKRIKKWKKYANRLHNCRNISRDDAGCEIRLDERIRQAEKMNKLACIFLIPGGGSWGDKISAVRITEVWKHKKRRKIIQNLNSEWLLKGFWVIDNKKVREEKVRRPSVRCLFQEL